IRLARPDDPPAHLPARPRRHPRGAAGAARRSAAGARLEPPPMSVVPTAASDRQPVRGARGRRRLVLGAVMLLLALPAAVAVEEAVTFRLRNRNNGALVAAGRHREYLLHLPPQWDRKRPRPLVIR